MFLGKQIVIEKSTTKTPRYTSIRARQILGGGLRDFVRRRRDRTLVKHESAVAFRNFTAETFRLLREIRKLPSSFVAAPGSQRLAFTTYRWKTESLFGKSTFLPFRGRNLRVFAPLTRFPYILPPFCTQTTYVNSQNELQAMQTLSYREKDYSNQPKRLKCVPLQETTVNGSLTLCITLDSSKSAHQARRSANHGMQTTRTSGLMHRSTDPRQQS